MQGSGVSALIRNNVPDQFETINFGSLDGVALGSIEAALVGAALELDAEAFGLWAGLSLQQTPQVVAAGLSHGAEAGAVVAVAATNKSLKGKSPV